MGHGRRPAAGQLEQRRRLALGPDHRLCLLGVHLDKSGLARSAWASGSPCVSSATRTPASRAAAISRAWPSGGAPGGSEPDDVDPSASASRPRPRLQRRPAVLAERRARARRTRSARRRRVGDGQAGARLARHRDDVGGTPSRSSSAATQPPAWPPSSAIARTSRAERAAARAALSALAARHRDVALRPVDLARPQPRRPRTAGRSTARRRRRRSRERARLGERRLRGRAAGRPRGQRAARARRARAPPPSGSPASRRR